jgi:hypothetical protein
MRVWEYESMCLRVTILSTKLEWKTVQIWEKLNVKLLDLKVLL